MQNLCGHQGKAIIKDLQRVANCSNRTTVRSLVWRIGSDTDFATALWLYSSIVLESWRWELLLRNKLDLEVLGTSGAGAKDTASYKTQTFRRQNATPIRRVPKDDRKASTRKWNSTTYTLVKRPVIQEIRLLLFEMLKCWCGGVLRMDAHFLRRIWGVGWWHCHWACWFAGPINPELQYLVYKRRAHFLHNDGNKKTLPYSTTIVGHQRNADLI